MYFSSRVQAGRMLAAQLSHSYQYKNCAVLAIDDGGVVIGAQIADELHCLLTLLEMAEILLPKEPTAIGGITASGTVTFNSSYSAGELDELISENFNYIEQEKLARMHDLHHLSSSKGTVNKELLKGKNVIVVSEGLKTGFTMDLAAEFLKPVTIERLIVATPLASVPAVDRMHVLADEIYCLSVISDYLDTNHYYDKNDLPPHSKIKQIVEQVIKGWE